MDTIARGLALGAKNIASGRGNKIAMLGNSIMAQSAPASGGALPGWTASTVVATNGYNMPKAYDLSNGYAPLQYQATTGGTTGAVEPIWPQVVGGTVTDGTVVWTASYLISIPAWGQGWWTFAQMLSGQRFSETFIVGASGKQSPVILSYLPRALATNPDIVLFANVFENDVWAGTAPTLSTITANFAAFVSAVDQVRNLGKKVIVSTVLPSGNIDATSTFTGYARGNGTKAWVWLNQKIRELARARSDVVLLELDRVYTDPNIANPVWPDNGTTYLSAAGSGQGLKATDGVHPGVAASYLLGQAAAPVLAANFPIAQRFGVAGEENQLHPNPLEYGTAGTLGVNSSGVVATAMTLNSYSASGTVTGTCSKVARADMAGSWQRCVYNASAGVADNASYNPTSNLALGNLAVGDIVQAFAELRILANPTLLTTPVLQLRFLGGTPQYVYSTNQASTDQDVGQVITTDTVLTLKTLPMAVSPSTTGLQLYGRANGRGAAQFTVDFGRFALGKVAVPTLA